MRHICFTEGMATYPISILIKPSYLRKSLLTQHYVKPLIGRGIPQENYIAWDLALNDAGKSPKGFARAYLETLLKAVEQVGSKYLLVADGDYFKALTNETKTSTQYGYVKDCVMKGYEHLKVVLIPNYGGLIYNPKIQDQIDLGLDAIVAAYNEQDTTIGNNVLQTVHYIDDLDSPTYLKDVKEALKQLLREPELGIDIEGFSLDFWKAGIATISFSKDQHTAVVINVDYKPYPNNEPVDNYYGEQINNEPAKKLLRNFFNKYRGKTIYHNIGYDAKVMVYELYMERTLGNRTGMLRGNEQLCSNFDDTQIITYLATNSCVGNQLGLKHNAHEFTGNYAMDDDDIKNIRRIPLPKLMEYNAVDTCATMYLRNKYEPVMIADEQEHVYHTIMKPSVKVIMDMELTGLPISMARTREVNAQLIKIQSDFHDELKAMPIMEDFRLYLRQLESDSKHETWKTKTAPIEEFDYVQFNPNSGRQLQILFYDFLGFPIVDKTKKGAGSTDSAALSNLKARATNPIHLDIFRCIMGMAEVSGLISTFMAAFLNRSIQHPDGWYYIHGSFRLGGTVSGRLSSANPNLQNTPSSGNRYSALVKSCVQAPPGYLLAGVDFESLEDKISALTTKDKNKLKVYTQGFDGHSFRAYGYWPEKFPDLVMSPESINSIKVNHEDVRQDSKEPTFLLTYGGTWHGLMKNLGWTADYAKKIENAFHTMYSESIEWVQGHIKKACEVGYVTVAFGLRLRTPLLHQVIYDRNNMPFAAQSESRTAGNALGQSYGMLNNRAAIEFREKVLMSEHLLNIHPLIHVHDSQYFMVPDDLPVVKWLNDNLIPCLSWQELPEIQHDTVKLSGSLEIHYPDWSHAIKIPNNATSSEIRNICKGK